MTSKGAANSRGTIFEYDLLSDTCIKKIDLEMAITGWSPGHSFVEVGCIAPGITASGPLSFCQGDSVTLTAEEFQEQLTNGIETEILLPEQSVKVL
ncbi:MAG: hypothetical protein IPP34_09520 [Bacteroidetes bacterium]|nr:hypothetical protein [Bacteroidota bacterium]